VSSALELGIFFLQLGRIRKYNLGDLCSRGGAVYPALESISNQLGQEAAVVQMRVSQQHRIYAIGGYGKWLPVSCQQMSFLIKSAIYQHPRAIGLQQVPRASDISSCAKKPQLYLHYMP
jgi:hypothetical protein